MILLLFSSLTFSFGYCFARNFHAVTASYELLWPFFSTKFNQNSLHGNFRHNLQHLHQEHYLDDDYYSAIALSNAGVSLSPLVPQVSEHYT